MPTETDPASFTCPRCGSDVRARFYGPCATCRDELIRVVRADPTAEGASASRFDPKMNVVPNHVATKE